MQSWQSLWNEEKAWNVLVVPERFSTNFSWHPGRPHRCTPNVLHMDEMNMEIFIHHVFCPLFHAGLMFDDYAQEGREWITQRFTLRFHPQILRKGSSLCR